MFLSVRVQDLKTFQACNIILEGNFGLLQIISISIRPMSLDLLPPSLPLDEEYNISSEESTLLKRVIGIQDDNELKEHLLSIQAETYAVGYRTCGCVHRFKIVKHPAYESVIKLGKERENAIFLDLPCCVGSDSRIIIADGYPLENVITSDLHSDYWTVGHKLFKTTPETFPVPFLQGDIFDPNFLQPGVPALDTSSQVIDSPSLTDLTSLTPLQHSISAIYTSCLIHLFGEDEQFKLAHLFASLLSPLLGSIIFGFHFGTSGAEEDKLKSTRLTAEGISVFAHSPASWKELWTDKNGPFRPEQVSVQVEVIGVERKDISRMFNLEQPYISYRHIWSITRY
ncbi:hypothetical protein Clacol_004060 [Clathrus columnatus]|uniref:Uncharacterized protein n=1 Tax=Clathrus columnatus TaxID=1419009 RepID=A0AAV5AA03_9AGAM|nr:hypothetical protein Clacol_004060 [Clathrus columnatus]